MTDEMEYPISSCDQFWKSYEKTIAGAPRDVYRGAFDGENVFTEFMGTSKINTLYQLPHVLYEVDGRCRRNR